MIDLRHGTFAPVGDAVDEGMHVLDFALPRELEAGEPPEARGLERDEVRLMVSYRADNRVSHCRFHDLPHFLDSGDVLVINTSGTLPAALTATRADETAMELHISTQLPAGVCIVELRAPDGTATRDFFDAIAGETLRLPAGASATLHVPYATEQRAAGTGRTRLWIATLQLPGPLLDYLARYGFPIRYRYVREAWPLNYYQTVYATEPGSAEMPSAGRAFTPELITRLVARGVQIAPLVLHTGVASMEEHEPPYEELYRVPVDTARVVNAARSSSRRVVAVGTTVVRAIETVTDTYGAVHAGEGWTRRVIAPHDRLRAVDALLTGMHEPRATHLAMLEALAGRDHLRVAYAEALAEGYLWHEFGDLHLILP